MDCAGSGQLRAVGRTLDRPAEQAYQAGDGREGSGDERSGKRDWNPG
jgi:hypothetical protein